MSWCPLVPRSRRGGPQARRKVRSRPSGLDQGPILHPDGTASYYSPFSHRWLANRRTVLPEDIGLLPARYVERICDHYRSHAQ